LSFDQRLELLALFALLLAIVLANLVFHSCVL
jgi:hypothetical protein